MKTDVSIAKNYLKGAELESLPQLVNGILELAERMAKRHIPMTVEDWARRIDIILEAGGDEILNDAGRITAEFAKELPSENSKIFFHRTLSPRTDGGSGRHSKILARKLFCYYRLTIQNDYETK